LFFFFFIFFILFFFFFFFFFFFSFPPSLLIFLCQAYSGNAVVLIGQSATKVLQQQQDRIRKAGLDQAGCDAVSDVTAYYYLGAHRVWAGLANGDFEQELVDEYADKINKVQFQQLPPSKTFALEVEQKVAGVAGGALGGAGGAWTGAETGAAIGTGIGFFFGGYGAVPGSIIGAYIGGRAGGAYGVYKGAKMAEKHFEVKIDGMKESWESQKQQKVEALTKEFIAQHMTRTDGVDKSPEACRDAAERAFREMGEKTKFNPTARAIMEQSVNAATGKVLQDHKGHLDQLRKDVDRNADSISKLKDSVEENFHTFSKAVDERFKEQDQALNYLKTTQDQMRADIKGLVQAQKDRAQAEAHQRRVESSFRNAQAAVGLLAGVLQATGHPKLAREVQVVGSSGLQIARGVMSIIAVGMNPAALLSLGGGVMTLVNGFMGGKDANEVLQEQIQALAQQMFEMEKHFDIRFDRLETMLGYMHQSILDGFKDVRNDIKSLEKLTKDLHDLQMKELHVELKDIKEMLLQAANEKLYDMCHQVVEYKVGGGEIAKALIELEGNLNQNRLDKGSGAAKLLKSDAATDDRAAALWLVLCPNGGATPVSPERFMVLGQLMVQTTISGVLKCNDFSADQKENMKRALEKFARAGNDFKEWRRNLLEDDAWKKTQENFSSALESVRSFCFSKNVLQATQDSVETERSREIVELCKNFDAWTISCQSSIGAWKNVQKTCMERTKGKVLVIRDYDSDGRMKNERFPRGVTPAVMPVRKDGSKQPSVGAVRLYKLGIKGRPNQIQKQLDEIKAAWKRDAQASSVRVALPCGYDQACLGLNVSLGSHPLPLNLEWIAHFKIQAYCDAEQLGLGCLTFSHSLSPHGLLTVRVDWQPRNSSVSSLLKACIVPIDPAVLLPHMQMMRYMNVSGLMQLWHGMSRDGIWDLCNSNEEICLRKTAPIVIQSAQHFKEYHQLFDAMPFSWRHFTADQLNQPSLPVIPDRTALLCQTVGKSFAADPGLHEALNRVTHAKVLLETHALLAFPDYLTRDAQELGVLLQMAPSGHTPLETLLLQGSAGLDKIFTALQLVSASLEDAASFVQFDQLVQVLEYLSQAADLKQLVTQSLARGEKKSKK
jgi:hypothetical protein